MKPEAILDALIARIPELETVKKDIYSIYTMWAEAFRGGHKLLLCGNGGSCADCEHIAGELVKGFLKKRPLAEEKQAALAAQGPEAAEMAKHLQTGLACISLMGHPSLTTAFHNDVDPDYTYAQQVMAYARPGDVFLGISTSGGARNVFLAAQAARACGLKVTGLTGKDGGRLAKVCDAAVIAPSMETYRIQEYHLPIYHALCAMVEETFFEE